MGGVCRKLMWQNKGVALISDYLETLGRKEIVLHFLV